MTDVDLRPARSEDATFIGEMLAEAASWDRPPGAAPPPLEELLTVSKVADYVEGWGRKGDGGVIAELDDRPVGACWFRLMTAEHPGYGFLAEDIPDLGLAVLPQHRGCGIGRRLLEGTILLARGQGFRSLGISVAEANRRARGLYESVGFVAVGREDDSLTMRLELRPG
jgi:ribosomal protein S18 acetylase RimI-like enzyme